MFYRRVINALFSEHDSKSKLGYEREKKCKLQQENIERILKAFCFISYFDGAFSFDYDSIYSRIEKVKSGLPDTKFSTNDFIHDMKVAISLWTEDGGIISFAHRSLQEYFAALFIKDLDDQNKERVYTKVLKHSEAINSINEIENFLSLCEEMDEASFYKHYALPLLHELKQTMEGRDPLNKFVTFFAKGISIRGSSNTRYPHYASVNRAVYKSIYFHLPWTIKLNNMITKVDQHKLFPEGTPSPQNDSYIEELPFSKTKGLKKNLLACLKEAGGVKHAERFKKYIDSEILKKTKIVENQMSSNSSFIDMIQ